MTKVWNTGENVKHDDLNQNFADLTSQLQVVMTASSTNTAALATLSAAATRNPATIGQDMAGKAIVNVAKAVASTSVPQLGQIGEQLLDRIGAVTGVNSVALNLPTGFIRFKVGWTVACPGNGLLAVRFSSDGATFDSSLAYYYGTQEIRSATGTEVYTGSVSNTLIYLNGTVSPNQIHNGTFDFGATGRGFIANAIYDANGSYYNYGSANYGPAKPVNSILLTHTSGQNFSGGQFWVTGVPG